jgi:hypothetical protein
MMLDGQDGVVMSSSDEGQCGRYVRWNEVRGGEGK